MPNHTAGPGGEVLLEVDSDVKEIDRARESFFRAYNSLEIDGFTTGLADDVVLMNHNGPPPIVGKEAVRSNYKEFFEEGPFIPKLTISSDEVVVLGDWAFDRGTWEVVRTYKRDGRGELLRSCYVIIWRRLPAETWRIARIIWNGAPQPVRGGNTS